MARSKPNLHPTTHPDLPIICNFSGGRTSGFMASYLNRRWPDRCINIFCNTGKEAHGTLDFVDQCDKHFNLDLVWLEYRSYNKFEIVDYNSASRHGEPFEALIKDKSIPSKMARSCTKELKERTSDRYLYSIGVKPSQRITAIGIRADEPHRLGTYYYPLALDMSVTKSFILDWWSRQVFDLDIPELLGNCDFCFLKSIKKRKAIAGEYPDKVLWWDKMEREYGYPHNYYFDMHNHMSVDQIIHESNLSSAQMELEFDCFCHNT